MRKLISFFQLLFLLSISVGISAQGVTDKQILEKYKGLRVTDVADGMDAIGLHDQGLMHQSIEALWKNIDDFSHMFCGIAVTVRYVPTNREFRTDLRGDEYDQWVGHWYNTYSPEPFLDSLKEGSVLVIDNSGTKDVGSVGSNNSMLWKERGNVGIVSNGGIRDTDEIIKQAIPVYLNMENRGRGIRPGRNELESVNKPVAIGGVLVNPGDVIVADGDGVIVVPRQFAIQVADVAHQVLDTDKAARKNLYKRLGIPEDFTVQ